MRMHFRASAAVAAVAVVALGVAACGSDSSSSGGASSSGGGSGDAVKIGVTYGGLKFPYHSALKVGIDQQAKELGNVKIVEADSNGDTNTELSNVQNLLQQQINCLLLLPVSSTSQGPVDAATGSNLPVVAYDQKAPGKITSFVGYNQFESGQLLGQFVIDQYKALGQPTAKAIYIRGVAGQEADTQRNLGLRDQIKKAGLADKIQIIQQAADYDRGKAESVARDLLGQHKDAHILVANNDDMILGAYAAAQALNIKTGPEGTLHLSGVDGLPETLNLISQKKIDATIAQNPLPEAKQALQACVNAARGKSIPSQTVLKFTYVKPDMASDFLAQVKAAYK
jgi:ribose transport system substrate-binding protein